MNKGPVKGVAEKVTKGAGKDLTGRTKEPGSAIHGSPDKLRDPPNPEAKDATDAIADAAERADRPSMSR